MKELTPGGTRELEEKWTTHHYFQLPFPLALPLKQQPPLQLQTSGPDRPKSSITSPLTLYSETTKFQDLEGTLEIFSGIPHIGLWITMPRVRVPCGQISLGNKAHPHCLL